MSQVLRACATGRTAGTSTTAVALELNVELNSECILTSKMVQGQFLPQSVCITNGFLKLFRNHLWEAHLDARNPHRGLDLAISLSS